MNLKELIWPVRIYWDLPENPSDSNRCLKICDEIIEIKILFLSLRDTTQMESHACMDVLDKLKGKNIGLSLTVSSAILNPSILARLSGASIKTLLVEASTLDEVRAALSLTPPFLPLNKGRSEEGLYSTGISFDVGKDNYREIPDVVSFCLNNGIRDLVFPIQRLAMNRDCFYMKKEDREELALQLAGLDHRKVRITIHDPFLWKAFYPDAAYHEGGCQAANSMLYISPDYRVYPCPAMPIELGNLHETTLREIILSGEKKELRSSLLNPPAECASCDQVGKCPGGCRGRAFASCASLDRRDPACN